MADFSTVAAGDTLEVLVRGMAYGLSSTGNGVYIGGNTAGTFILSTDTVGFSKIVLPWAEGDAVRVTSLDDQFVRNADGWWFNANQQQVADEDVDKYQSLGELKVLYAPGRG